MEVFKLKAKKIRKWSFLIIIFILISLLFIRVITYIMKPINENLNNIAGFYGEEKNTLDMVYIGGSAAFVYYEPLRAFEQEGIASYNYAANTIQPELYKTMIKEILKTQKPELIIIDARAFQYRGEEKPPTEVAYRNVLTGMPFSLNKIEFIYENVGKYLKEGKASYCFDIIKYHRDLKGASINNQIKMAFNMYTNPLKGFFFVTKVAKQTKAENNTDKKTPIAEETEEILIDLLEYCKTTECNYLFVVSPYEEEKLHKENFNYISEIINQYGYNFLDANDFYDEMDLNFETDLYNDGHVNIFGAEKYTDFLIDYLQSNYNLSDRRKDPKYQSWFDLLDDWNKQVDSTKTEINKLIEENS